MSLTLLYLGAQCYWATFQTSRLCHTHFNTWSSLQSFRTVKRAVQLSSLMLLPKRLWKEAQHFFTVSHFEYAINCFVKFINSKLLLEKKIYIKCQGFTRTNQNMPMVKWYRTFDLAHHTSYFEQALKLCYF